MPLRVFVYLHHFLKTYFLAQCYRFILYFPSPQKALNKPLLFFNNPWFMLVENSI